MMQKPVVWFLVGPTGSGKTSVAIKIALETGAEIVSADSRQIYKHMDIGTAKPTRAQMALVPHHLIDVTDPSRPISAAEYKRLAQQAIADIFSRGKQPLVVGGTGMYIRALTQELNFASAPGDPRVRKKLNERIGSQGSETLWRELESKDPDYAAIIHPNDNRRIIRALEIIELTGTIPSRSASRGEPPYGCKIAGILWKREKLYGIIDQRALDMIKSGFAVEVEKLFGLGFGPDLKPLKSIGYGVIIRYLAGELDMDQAAALIQRDTRRFAKRQMTYFRALPGITWFDPEVAEQSLSKIIISFFQDLKGSDPGARKVML